jgi:hypothetical protein
VSTLAILPSPSATPAARRLKSFGKPIGQRAAELTNLRHREGRRILEVSEACAFVSDKCWSDLFGAPATLETVDKGRKCESSSSPRWPAHSTCADNIVDKAPITNRFMDPTPIPANLLAGIAQGLFDGLGFDATIEVVLSKGEYVFVTEVRRRMLE